MKQYGSFGGFYTYNNFEFGNIEKGSILIFDNEDKAISYRYDVNTHLYVLYKKKSYQVKQSIICVKSSRIQTQNCC